MVKKRKQAGNRRPARRRDGAGGSAAASWLYGLHAVRAALANPARTPRRLLIAGPDVEIPETPALAPEIVGREAISALLPPGAVHQGVALLAEAPPAVALEDFCALAAARETALAVVLDQVTDPRNVGAVLRSAAFFGADAVILPERHAPPASGALAKAASGALESVPLIRVGNIARALAQLKQAGFWCAGLDAAAPATLAEAGLGGRIALVLGAEGRGLRRLTRERCDHLVRIAGAGAVESLNVSAAAAVALHALARLPRPAGEDK